MNTEQSPRLKGFPVSYSLQFSQRMTKDMSSSGFSRRVIEDAGESLRGFVRSDDEIVTGDYGWYTALQIKRGGAKFMFLFPWLSLDKPKSTDRPVEIYATKETPLPKVQGLVHDLEMALYKTSQSKQAIHWGQ